MTHAELREMLGLYALGALEAHDAAALAAHLEKCPSCLAELVNLEESVAELAHAAGPIPPPADVTSRILRAAGSGPPLAALPPVRTARPARRRRTPGGWRRRLRVTAGVAVAAGVAFLVVSEITLRQRLDRAFQTLARGRDLLEFIASPDVTTVSLAATGSAPGARAFVAYDRRSGRLVLFAFHLQPPPEDQVYQLWLISDGVRPSAVFSPDPIGATLLHEHALPERRGVPLFAITLEPSGGGPEPTGRILLLGGRPRSLPDVDLPPKTP